MIRTKNSLARAVVAGLALIFAVSVAGDAEARKGKSTQTEADWVKFDSASNTVVVKIRKSKGPNKKMLKKGKEATFNVKPEGSVLTRTTVAINGVKGEITDINVGKTVLIYWIPDEKKDGEFFARKIDVVLSEEELTARYGEAE